MMSPEEPGARPSVVEMAEGLHATASLLARLGDIADHPELAVQRELLHALAGTLGCLHHPLEQIERTVAGEHGQAAAELDAARAALRQAEERARAAQSRLTAVDAPGVRMAQWDRRTVRRPPM